MNFKKFFLTFFTVIISIAGYSQTVDEILSKYFENTGGMDKWKNLESVKAVGTAPTPQGDFEVKIFSKAPNKIKVEINVGGKTMIPQAYDGETAWNLTIQSDQAQKLPEAQTKMMAEEAVFEDDFINYKEKGHVVELEGTEEIDGVETFKIKLTKNASNDKKEKVEYHFFDKENYIPIMTRTTLTEGQAAGTVVETLMSDYQETDYGLMMPYYIETRFNSQPGQKVVINEYMINSGIEDSVFEFPG